MSDTILQQVEKWGALYKEQREHERAAEALKKQCDAIGVDIKADFRDYLINIGHPNIKLDGVTVRAQRMLKVIPKTELDPDEAAKMLIEAGYAEFAKVSRKLGVRDAADFIRERERAGEEIPAVLAEVFDTFEELSVRGTITK